MDDLHLFGPLDQDAVIDTVNLEDLSNALTEAHERPYLFTFAIRTDADADKSVAKTAVKKFKTFNQILKDPVELRKYGYQFEKWMIRKKTAENAKDNKKPTHVAMNQASFCIPPEEEMSFLKQQAVILAAGHSLWLIERPTPVFRLFFDMDFKNLGPISGAGIEAAALVVGRTVKKFFPSRNDNDTKDNLRMVVCCTDIKPDTIEGPSGKVNVHKTGVHLHWPNVFVNGAQAMTIRESVLAEMQSTFGPRVPPYQNMWEDVIDSSVFFKDGREGSGLRMQGSRKTEACSFCKRGKLDDGSWCSRCSGGKVDVGRPQSLLFATDGTLRRSYTQEDLYIANLESLIVDISIRSHLGEEHTQANGFSVPEGAPVYLGHVKTKVVRGEAVGATTLTRAHEIPSGSLWDTLQSVIRDAFVHYKQVVVNSVKQNIRDKTYIVNVTGFNSHYCQNIGREHKSNRIQFSVSQDGVVQRCQDPSDAMSEEMRFGLCKHQASAVGMITKAYRDRLWPRVEEAATCVTLMEVSATKPKSSSFQFLLQYGDYLCQKLFGTSYSMTLTFGTDRRMVRDAKGQLATVGTEDLGLRSHQALKELGFPVKDLPEVTDVRTTIREKTLNELESSVWDTLFAWVDLVAYEEKAPNKRVRLTEFVQRLRCVCSSAGFVHQQRADY